MGRFVVCIHDATPVYACETQAMLRDLAPLVGRRLSFGVVPDWHGEWPISAHADYCRLLAESSDELLLHGYHHRRARGSGAATWLAERSDEMNGLDRDETRRMLERGQAIFTQMFDAPARGFIAPAWQQSHARATNISAAGTHHGLDYVLGFFALESSSGQRIPLATYTWDCGRWRALGYVGHALGAVRDSLQRAAPVLAIHPRDLARGFWPRILRLTESLLARGYEPATPADLLEARRAEARL